MKKITSVYSVSLIVGVILTLSACSQSIKEKIIGSWQCEMGGKATHFSSKVTYHSDGTLNLQTFRKGTMPNGEKYRLETEENQEWELSEDESFMMMMTVEAKILVIEPENMRSKVEEIMGMTSGKQYRIGIDNVNDSTLELSDPKAATSITCKRM